MGQRGLLTYADLVHREDVGTKFDQLINGHFQPVWDDAKTFQPSRKRPTTARAQGGIGNPGAVQPEIHLTLAAVTSSDRRC